MTKIFLIIILLSLTIGLVSCDNHYELDPTVKAQMRYDWQAQFGFELNNDIYLGSFSASEVIFIEGDATVITEREIAGFNFLHNMDWQIWVWQDNYFKALKVAYTTILTRSDVHGILNAFRNVTNNQAE